MLGDKPDEQIREPFIWYTKSKLPETNWEPITSNTKTDSVEKQQSNTDSLLNYYKTIMKLRQGTKYF
jgi:alpha-amylase